MAGRATVRWTRRLGVIASATAFVVAGMAGVAQADNPWVRIAAPAPGTSTALQSVSCVTETVCTAVGNYSTASGTRSLIVRTTDGSTWTRQAAPNSPGASQNLLQAVSCTSATHCTAVGYSSYTDDILVVATVPLIVRTTDGVTWSPAGGRITGLWTEAMVFAVSCRSEVRCYAVGTVMRDRRSALVLRTTNGTFWHEQTEQAVPGNEHWLRGLDCTSNVRCTAVGSYSSGSQLPRTLVMRTVDGRTWSHVPSPNAAPATTGSVLDDVDCVSMTCTAVGYGSIAERALILRTADGATWSRLPTPVVAGQWFLRSINCQTTTSCTTVGRLAHGSTSDLAILRTTDGANWYAPDPAAQRVRRFGSDVSCATPLRCFAVGNWRETQSAPAKALILRET